MRIPVEYLISICSLLLLISVSSLVVFDVYAQQQGSAATGGRAQLNQGTGLIITCTVNNACIITGNSGDRWIQRLEGNANNSPSNYLLPNNTSSMIKTDNTNK